MVFLSAPSSSSAPRRRPRISRRSVLVGLRSLLVTAALLVLSVSSQQPDTSKQPGFLFPVYGEKAIYYLSDTVLVTYYSFYDAATLYIFCRPGVGQRMYEQETAGFNTTVPVYINFTYDAPCWFNLRTGPINPDGFRGSAETGSNSETFNIIGEQRSGGGQLFGLDHAWPLLSSLTSSSTATATLSSSSSTSGSGGGSSSSTVAANSSSNTPNANVNPGASEASSLSEERSGGLGAGASAGIGIGVSLGVIAVAGGAFVVWWRRRHRGRTGAVELGDRTGGNNNRPPPDHGSAGVGQYHEVHDEAAIKWHDANRELGEINYPVEIATPNLAGELGRTHHEMEA